MEGASLLGEVGFAPTFSDPEKSSYKLMEVDEAMLRYLLGGGSLQLKARPGCDLVACTGDSTFSVTLVESSNTMLLTSSSEPVRAEGGRQPASGNATPAGARHLVYGAAPGMLELGRIAPALHVLRNQLVKHALDQGSIDGYKHSCARSAGVSGGAAEIVAGSLEVGSVGLPSKRQRTGSDSEALAGLTRQPSDASIASRSSGSAAGRRGAVVGLGVGMGALLEGVPASAAEVAAGLAALRAVRVPAAFVAYLEACGAALRAEAPEPDAEPADDDDADAVAARAVGRDVYCGCQHDAAALWSVVDDECAFAVLQAALLAASAYAWDLGSLPVDDLVEQLCPRFPRFLTRHVICTVFGPPPLGLQYRAVQAPGQQQGPMPPARLPALARTLPPQQPCPLRRWPVRWACGPSCACRWRPRPRARQRPVPVPLPWRAARAPHPLRARRCCASTAPRALSPTQPLVQAAQAWV
jgi:hypothetical protein